MSTEFRLTEGRIEIGMPDGGWAETWPTTPTAAPAAPPPDSLDAVARIRELVKGLPWDPDGYWEDSEDAAEAFRDAVLAIIDASDANPTADQPPTPERDATHD